MLEWSGLNNPELDLWNTTALFSAFKIEWYDEETHARLSPASKECTLITRPQHEWEQLLFDEANWRKCGKSPPGSPCIFGGSAGSRSKLTSLVGVQHFGR